MCRGDSPDVIRDVVLNPRLSIVACMFFNSFFRCSFCRKPLRPAPMSLVERASFLVGYRAYKCPHCFTRYWRPVTLLRLVFAPMSFGRDPCDRRTSNTSTENSETSNRPPRAVV